MNGLAIEGVGEREWLGDEEAAIQCLQTLSGVKLLTRFFLFRHTHTFSAEPSTGYQKHATLLGPRTPAAFPHPPTYITSPYLAPNRFALTDGSIP